MKAAEKMLKPKPFHENLQISLSIVDIDNLRGLSITKYKGESNYSYYFMAFTHSVSIQLGLFRFEFDFKNCSLKQDKSSCDSFKKAGVDLEYRLSPPHFLFSPEYSHTTQTSARLFTYILRTFCRSKLLENVTEITSLELFLKCERKGIMYL